MWLKMSVRVSNRKWWSHKSQTETLKKGIIKTRLLNCDPQTEAPASPGNLWEVQILRPGAYRIGHSGCGVLHVETSAPMSLTHNEVEEPLKTKSGMEVTKGEFRKRSANVIIWIFSCTIWGTTFCSDTGKGKKKKKGELGCVPESGQWRGRHRRRLF